MISRVIAIAGKILEDGKTVKDSKIEEKNFVVVMVSKVGDITLLSDRYALQSFHSDFINPSSQP